MSQEIFAQRIRELRENHNMTTRMLGEVLGISHSSIVYYENCKREPTLTVMKAYAKYFKVTLDYLVGMEDNNGKN